MVSEEGPGSWKLPLHLPAGQGSCQQQKEDAGLAQGEPYRGVSEGDLASQLHLLIQFRLNLIGRFWINGQFKASQQNREPAP